ncbi:MAG: hypothetical protein HQK53_18975 [Oligoflexia bacterium]|nr:hypothetical protein [Oligoflexia bacterium]
MNGITALLCAKIIIASVVNCCRPCPKFLKYFSYFEVPMSASNDENREFEKLKTIQSLEEIIINGSILWMEKDTRQLCLFRDDGREINITLGGGKFLERPR